MAGSVPYYRRRVGESQIRVGDAERESALSALREHYAHGRLDGAELEERVSAALVARTRGDLASLFVDLPGERRAWPPPPRRRMSAWAIVGRVVAAAMLAALVSAVLGVALLLTLLVITMTFGGVLWALVFWWLLARWFGGSCGRRRGARGRSGHQGYWQHPGRITRV
jgi:hypothetical protein